VDISFILSNFSSVLKFDNVAITEEK